MLKIGLIGGSGLSEIPGLNFSEEKKVETPYGAPSAPYRIARMEGMEIIFLLRHGAHHEFPPHKLNYRANLCGMKSLGVTRIITLNATGALSPELLPGDIVIPDQIIDFTMGARPSSYFDEKEAVHVDFSRPYCPELRSVLKGAASKLGIPSRGTGTYVAVNGPRLETAAEVRFFNLIGGHIIGMTGMPEAALARELEICYAALAIVTNQSGMLHAEKITATEVVKIMEKSTGKIQQILKEAFPLIPVKPTCTCGEALKDSRL